MRRKMMILFVTLIALGLIGCTTAPPPSNTQRVLIDVIPTQASDQYRQQIAHLGKLLSTESGLDVAMRVATDYAAVVEAMRFGKSDIAFFGPFTYVVANAQSGAEAFITQTVNGKPYYYSYGIVLKDSPIRELNDAGIASLKGMRIALGDPNSTSAAQIPQLVMQRAGLDSKSDVDVVFTHAHDAVLKTVVAGKANIGFLDSAIFEGSLTKRFPEDVAKVRVVYQSMPLYQYPWAHRKDLDQAVVAKLREAFLKIKDPKALEPFGADSFVVAEDRLYDPVRDAAKALGVDLEGYKLKQ
jgi:phosphonate transport system substrate-binding protein